MRNFTAREWTYVIWGFIAGYVLLSLVGCLPPVSSPTPYALGRPPLNDERLALHLDSAAIVGVGTLLKAWHAEQYEPLGFVTAGKAPQAYIGRIRFDRLLKGKDRQIEVAYFVYKGNALPVAGLVALWIVHYRDVLLLKMCSEAGLTEFSCRGLKEYRLALDTDEDVLPLETAERAARLLRIEPFPSTEEQTQ